MLVRGAATVAPAAAQTTAFAYDSQPGDALGQGRRQTFTTADLNFTASAFPDRTRLDVMALSSDLRLFWSATVVSTGGLPLAPGIYENALKEDSVFDTWPGVTIASSSSRSCITAAGRFQIHEVVFGSAGEVIRFAADIEYHCERATPAIFAAVRYNSTRASLEAFDGQYPVYALRVDAAEHGYVTAPGIDCGAGRLDCDETYAADANVTVHATPLPGYFLLGWVGDCLGNEAATVRISRRRFCAPVFEPSSGSPPGAPRTAMFIDGDVHTLDHVYFPGPPAAALRAEIRPHTVRVPTPAAVDFLVEGHAGVTMSLEFRAPSRGILTPGTYEAFGNAADRTVNLRGSRELICNDGGRFTLYEYTLQGSTVMAFAADFEVLCATGLVTGSIRYRSSRTSLVPFDGVYPAPAHVLVVAPTIGGFVTGPGIDCGDGGRSDCREIHSPATALQLHAEASSGYQFVGWSGSCAGGGQDAALTVHGRQRCFAVFTPVVGSGATADPFLREATLVIDDLASPDNRAVWLGAHSGVGTFVHGDVIGIEFPGRAQVVFRLQRGRLVTGGYEDGDAYPRRFGPVVSFDGCSLGVARTWIYEATFDTLGRLRTFAADVEGRCLAGTLPPHFVAAVRYNATREGLIPFDGAYPVHRLTIEPPESGFITGPGVSCGSGRSACTISSVSPFSVALVATPLPGSRFLGWTGACGGGSRTTIAVEWLRSCSAVFTAAVPRGIEDQRTRWAALMTDSEPGDPVGEGERRIWLDAEIVPALFGRGLARINVRLAEGKEWWIYLEAPAGRDLAPGAYDNAVDAFGDNPGAPGIQVRWRTEVIAPADGAACPGPPIGRFVIHELTFSSGAIASLAVDFEQRCTPGGPALKGSIRFRARRLVLRPFAPTTFVRPARRPADFNADGFADLAWRHASTGQNAVWFMNGVKADLTTLLSPAGAARVSDLSWEIRAIGDMNGDGAPDLIWQHAGTGRLAVWFLSGATRIGTDYIYAADGSSTESDLDWKIVAAADMDADGQEDLLWRHRVSGALRLWHMTGARQWDEVTLGTVDDADWTIVGVVDMNDDGLPDLVWQNRRTGGLAAWLMRDASLQATPPLSHAPYDPRGWTVAGVGDLNQDAKPDLVWQNTATGELGVWFMDGVTQIGGRHLDPPRISNAGWRIVGVR